MVFGRPLSFPAAFSHLSLLSRCNFLSCTTLAFFSSCKEGYRHCLSHSSRPAFCSIAAAVKRNTAGPADLTPLFERPASYQATVSELLHWRRWAQDMASSVGTRYCDADGGPDADELLRELEWLLEDATKGCISSTNRAALWDWKIIKSNASMSSTSSCSENQVLLRAPLEELSSLWTQRVKLRRPFQYVVGCAHWRDYVLCVKEGVLIPRPETEQMIDLAEEAMKASPALRKGIWADLGTGSGAIAIGLACLLDPVGLVVAVDISEDALYIAQHNVQRYGLQDKVEILCGSWFSVLEDKKGKLAGIASNPPYIPSHQVNSLQAEVGRYEPRKALDGGQQGMDDLIKICEGASWSLCSHGRLILETNGGEQANVIAEFLKGLPETPFCDIKLVKDYAGITRFVTAVHV